MVMLQDKVGNYQNSAFKWKYADQKLIVFLNIFRNVIKFLESKGLGHFYWNFSKVRNLNS